MVAGQELWVRRHPVHHLLQPDRERDARRPPGQAHQLRGVQPVAAVLALALDAGTIEAGKLADLVIVDGDPLSRIGDTRKVKRVIANGRLYEMSQLINGASSSRTSTQR